MRENRRTHDPDFDGDDVAFAKYFKERVYATFTGLAIVLVVAVAEHPHASHGLTALLLGVGGIVSAGLVSDVIAHLAVHRSLPGRGELLLMLRIAAGGLGTVVAPAIVLLLAVLGVFADDPALTAATIIYLLTLAVIGWLAVRRSRLSWWAQIIVLAVLIVLGLAVIGIQTLAHNL
ncbi:hypothetical protein ACTU3I_02840 [Microbacterium sp. RD1]|uniref:hypothetical protein n=1 Tax=Microbacterium sp. RD1 TaxID=3457313 RepID=UPI003FA5FB61